MHTTTPMNNTKPDSSKTKDIPGMNTKKAEPAAPAAHKSEPSMQPKAESCGTPAKAEGGTTDKMAYVATDKDTKGKSDMPKADMPKANTAKTPVQSAAHK